MRLPIFHDLERHLATVCDAYVIALRRETGAEHTRDLRFVVDHQNVGMIRHQRASWLTMCTSTEGDSRRNFWIAERYKYLCQPVRAERPKITCVMWFSRTRRARPSAMLPPVVLTTCAPRFSAKRTFSANVFWSSGRVSRPTSM